MKWFAVFAALAAIAGLVAGALAFKAHYDRISRDAATLASCKQAAGGALRTRGSLADSCPAPIAALAVAGAASQACDGSLVSQDAFGAAQACSAPVKRVIAERNAARTEATNRGEELARERSGRAAAIARAEARATQSNRQRERADEALRTAPRGADGLADCDAECLRALAGG